jgi:Nitroreductase
MNYKTEKLNFKILNSQEIMENSKKFYNNIKKRRSIRNFDNKKININVIKNAILSAGTAPNGANLQPWHFVIIKDKI